MGFWSSVLLPLLLCLLVFVDFFNKSDHAANQPGIMLWMEFSAVLLLIMGSLILPMLIVFIAYSVNSIEHKADTWKTLFSLPIPKFSIYTAKYLYAFFLVLLCLSLFVLFTLGFGNLLSVLKPALKFSEYNAAGALMQVYFKLFLSALGILSIQFLLSLLFRDFLKPMGIGFVCAITGAILAGNNWTYAYLFPYSQPMVAVSTIKDGLKNNMQKGSAAPINVDIFTKEIWVSLSIAVLIFIAGYFIVLKKSVK